MVTSMAKRHTPIRRYIFRNTRSLLRVYREKGLLKENIPYRDPKPVWIDMRHDESELYERIEEYIRHHYQKYEAERKGLGFIMTVYRRRLTSSFYAIEQSLKRRLGFLRGTLGLDQLVTDDDTDQEDLEQDVVDSGRGGERWQDGKWVGTSKENVKTAFRPRRSADFRLRI